MSNKLPKYTTLAYALLGLIKMNPCTGYALRKIFEETPMANYSSSPGAIYPALRNLKADKLVRVEQGIGKTGRNTQTFHCTTKGTRILLAWLRNDVTADSVYRELDVELLRFSYLDLVNDLDWSIEFLNQFRQAAQCCHDQVKRVSEDMSAFQPLHGQLALVNGAQVFEAHVKWADAASTMLIRKRGKER